MHLSCDMVSQCLNYKDEEGCQMSGLCNGHLCRDGSCLPRSLIYDLFPDCPGLTPNDEQDLLLPRRSNRACSGGRLPCQLLHSHCYDVEFYCVYDFDDNDNLYPCRNGGHDCINSGCPGMFKCPSSYCIPTHRVCDARPDCPGGSGWVS